MATVIPYFMDDPLGALWPAKGGQVFHHDDSGILMLSYPEGLGKPSFIHIGNQYHPVAISAYALSRCNAFLKTGDEQSQQAFLRHADWLEANLVEANSFAAWVYEFAWRSPGYRANPPWISSMAQGMGISVLVRAWQMTDAPGYLAAAERALTPFAVPVSAGGLLRKDPRGDTWYEGIPSPIGAQILNEIVFALVGLHDLGGVGNHHAEELLGMGVDTMRRRLKDFDLHLPFFKWSKYDNRLILYSGDTYHPIHIRQLEWLAEVTGDELFRAYQTKWEEWQAKYGRDTVLARRLFLRLWRIHGLCMILYTRLVQR